MVDVVRHGRLKWFWHLERKIGDDWVSVYKNVEVLRIKSRDRETWGECVKDDLILLGLQLQWAIFMDMWRDFILGKHLSVQEMDDFKINDQTTSENQLHSLLLAAHQWQQ